MFYLAWILTLGVAALHAYFLWLEMFEWERPRTRAIFGTDPTFAAESRVLAANMGLYNGFLALGLLVGLMNGIGGRDMVFYLLLCIVVAGIYGGATVSMRVALVQAVPAALALVCWWVA